jgi:hypothetical protein
MAILSGWQNIIDAHNQYKNNNTEPNKKKLLQAIEAFKTKSKGCNPDISKSTVLGNTTSTIENILDTIDTLNAHLNDHQTSKNFTNKN